MNICTRCSQQVCLHDGAFCDDLGDVYQLFRTLNPNTHLAKFAFILTWDEKTEKEKQELYSKFACHELSFFLMRKDPAFFEKVVVAHLRNKRDKTFLDHYLLKENLDEFVTPWKYARLNVVEKTLLAQRLEARSKDIERNINELYLLTPTTRARFDGLYDTTIRGLGLDRSGPDWSRFKGGREKNLPQLSDLRRKSSRDAGRELSFSAEGLSMDAANDASKEIAGKPGEAGASSAGVAIKSEASPKLTAPAAPQAMFAEEAEKDFFELEDRLERESINGKPLSGVRSVTRNLAKKQIELGIAGGAIQLTRFPSDPMTFRTPIGISIPSS